MPFPPFVAFATIHSDIMASVILPNSQPRTSQESVLPLYRPVDVNPPTYRAPPDISPEALAGLNAALTSIDLAGSKNLSEDRCLVHLKLLHAFQQLKDDVGYTDGLWQLFDARAAGAPVTAESHDKKKSDKCVSPEAAEAASLAKRVAEIREKRWALFVARAVDRYEAWLKTFAGTPLTEEMFDTGGPGYTSFPAESDPIHWTESMLPPLGKYSPVDKLVCCIVLT